MTTWRALGEELDRWADQGRRATLWWRDDDAGAADPALDRLIRLRRRLGVPLALAVVPAALAESTRRAVLGDAGVTVLQHGFDHGNRASAGEKKSELGPHRPVELMAAEVGRGLALLRAGFGGQALAVLVPPWNRIAAALVAHLAGQGFVGLSCFGPRRAACAAGLVAVNAHVDPVDWHRGRGFIGEGAALAATVGHLVARRDGRADRDEPTGLLTHHLVHDAEGWAFVARLVGACRDHPGARWLGAAEVFAGAAP